MSDLISRSALKKEIESIYLNVSGVRSGKGILAKCMDSYKKAVLEVINNQPTAYDEEKFVADLQKEIEWAENHGKSIDFRKGRLSGLRTAIRISRNGGAT